MTTYRIDYFHTVNLKWYEYSIVDTFADANEQYNKALAWHYAGIVRIVKVTQEVLKQSKEDG